MAAETTILAIDIGTTHCKAGLFALNGAALKIAKVPMAVQHTPSGEAYFDPEALWGTVCTVIRKAAGSAGSIAAVGIASMAETGLLVDRHTGEARSFLSPGSIPRPSRRRISSVVDPTRWSATSKQVCGPVLSVAWRRCSGYGSATNGCWMAQSGCPRLTTSLTA